MIDNFSPIMILGQKHEERCHSGLRMRATVLGQGKPCLLVDSYDDHSSSRTQTSLCSSNNNNKKRLALVEQWSHQPREGICSPLLPPRKKVVSFAKTCKVKLHLALAEYSNDEIMACWYSKEEVSERRRKSRLIVLKLRGGEGCRYCVRGLESLVPEVAARRTLLRRKVCYIVLREQENQRLTQVYNPEAIARKYRNLAARDCQLAAYQQGHEDKMVALKARPHRE